MEKTKTWSGIRQSHARTEQLVEYYLNTLELASIDNKCFKHEQQLNDDGTPVINFIYD